MFEIVIYLLLIVLFLMIMGWKQKYSKTWGLLVLAFLVVLSTAYCVSERAPRIKAENMREIVKNIYYYNGEWLIEDRYVDAFKWVAAKEGWKYCWWDFYRDKSGALYEFPLNEKGFFDRLKLENNGVDLTKVDCYKIRDKYWYLSKDQEMDFINVLSRKDKFNADDYPRFIFVARERSRQ